MKYKAVFLFLTLITLGGSVTEVQAACKGVVKAQGEHHSQHGARVKARQRWYMIAGADYKPQGLKFNCRKNSAGWRCVMLAVACRSGGFKAK